MKIVALFLALASAPTWVLSAADPTPSIRGDFGLTNASTGARVTQDSFKGRYRLVFFGFTHCPMTCPLGLHTIGEVLAVMGKDAAKIQPVFITIDPERDTAKVVDAYLRGFDARIVGLVGDPTAIHAAMRDYRLEAERDGSGDDYQFEHPAIIFFMDPNGKYITTLPSRGDAAQIAAELRNSMKG